MPNVGPIVDPLTLEVKPSTLPYINRELNIESGVFILRLDINDPKQPCLTLPDGPAIQTGPGDGQLQVITTQMEIPRSGCLLIRFRLTDVDGPS